MSLAAPLFLIALLALTIPWWLHLISTDDPPAQDFSSDMLLEQQQTVSSKQSQLRYWLLLLLRTLAIALLALLFAEPVIEKLKMLTEQSTRHLVVVDTSMSQGHQQRWNRTQSQARDIISALPSGDQVLLVNASDTIQATSESDLLASTAITQLESVTPGNQQLSFAHLATAIDGLVRESPLPVEVHLVSDMQQSAMPDRFADLAISGVEELHLYSTAAADDLNVSVTAVVNESADNQTSLSALVQNHSATAVAIDVRVSGNNGVLDTRNIQLAADSRTVVPFDNLDTRSAGGRLAVELSPMDDLPADDRFIVAIPDGERLEIPVISGIRESIAHTYVTAAVESDPRYSARLISGDNINAAELGSMTIVPDASTLTDRGGSDLKDYIEKGGAALVISGSEPHSSSMRNLLNLSANTASPDVSHRVVATDTSQPVIQGVSADWRALSLQHLLPTNSDADDRVILATDYNTPLLIERNVGRGQLLVFTSALDPLWNNLALEPLFLPFIIRSVEYLRGESTASRKLNIGDAMNIPAGAQLLNSEGESLRSLAELNQRSSFTFRAAGVYTVRSPAGDTYVSVNTDPLESTLTALGPDQLERWKNLGSNRAASGTNSVVQNTDSTTRQSLWLWILSVLLVVTLLESLYSHRHLWVKRGA